ncbi:UNVERIFIED_CONTAM: hypothetical protein FKN15_011590 [Acipenser sinensis]
MSHVLKEMLVPVECKRVQLYVRVPKTDHKYDYTEFIQAVSEKFNLPPEIHVDLKDSSGIEVDPDIFDELMTSSEVSFKVFTGEQSGVCASVLRSVLTLRRAALRRLVSAICHLVQRFGALCSASALGASASALGDFDTSMLGARTSTLGASTRRRSVHAPRRSALRRVDARCTHLDARRFDASTLGARTSTLGASTRRRSVHAPRRSALRRVDARCTHLDARRFDASLSLFKAAPAH